MYTQYIKYKFLSVLFIHSNVCYIMKYRYVYVIYTYLAYVSPSDTASL